MIHQQTLCGICTQSHGVERCGLNLEVLKFQLIMTDRVVGMVRCATKLQADVILDGLEVCVCVCREVGGGVD